MSRIGKQLITVPTGVTVDVNERGVVTVKGPRGELTYRVHPAITVSVRDGVIHCEVRHQSKAAGALWGTTRARIANLVVGVTQGFRKQLELHGVGYRAQLKGSDLVFSLGYSHSITVKAPAGISFTVEKEVVTVDGIDPVLVGQVAADIRKLRKPEPYKGKGVRYVGERIRRKVGKVVGTTA